MNAEDREAQRVRDACRNNRWVMQVREAEFLAKMEALNRDRQRREAEAGR